MECIDEAKPTSTTDSIYLVNVIHNDCLVNSLGGEKLVA